MSAPETNSPSRAGQGGFAARLRALASTPGALRLLTISVIARLPMAMLSIGMLIHAKHLTGSFAAAGIVDGAYALSLAIGGPLLGQLVDRRGQTMVLLGSAIAAAALLFVLAVMPAGVPLPVLAALAIGVGLAVPPVGACLRALFPGLIGDQEALRAVYAVDATAVELTWILGPPLALALGAAWSTGGALGIAGLVVLVGTAVFAAQPASKAWQPDSTQTRPRGGALGTPAMRTLVIALVAVGAVFGAVQMGVAAAAAGMGSTASAGPLLGIWGIGSLLGGLLAARLGGGARTGIGLASVLGALTVGHLSLAAVAGNAVAMAIVLLIVGAAIAPTYATVYAMVDKAAPSGTATEAFAWLATAISIGASAGAAGAGSLADSWGPVAAFVFAGSAGAVAVMVTLLRLRTLGSRDVGRGLTASAESRLGSRAAPAQVVVSAA
jgi:MFS family permease